MQLQLSTGIVTKRGQRENNQDAVFHYAELFELDFLEKYADFNEQFLVFRSTLYDAMKRFRSAEWLMKERPIQDFEKKFPVIYKFIDEVITNAAKNPPLTPPLQRGGEGRIDTPEIQDVIIRELETLSEQCLDLPLFVKLYGIQIKSALLEGKAAGFDVHETFLTEYEHKVFRKVFSELKQQKGLDEVDRNYLQSPVAVEQEKRLQSRIKTAIETWGRLFAVADGVAGSQDGHFASRFVTSALRRYYEAKQHITSGLSRGEILKWVIEEIDDELSRRGKKASGTTLTAALIEEERLWVCWVGDTEAYLIRPGETEEKAVYRLTPGHGEVSHQEARQRFVSYMGQGLKGSVHLETLEPDEKLLPGDRIVIASDGLTRFIKQKRIKEIVCKEDLTAQEAAEALVKEATPFSDDNITAVVIKIDKDEVPQQLPSRSPKMESNLLKLLANLWVFFQKDASRMVTGFPKPGLESFCQ